MANPVQRLRYFDGEYLRSYDFTDEQSYHIAMRRLMNLRLHLHGIVYGLDIVMDQDSVLPGGPFFFSIAPGMAIDKSGREIVVASPYSLTNVLNAPGLGVGNYEVWICLSGKPDRPACRRLPGLQRPEPEHAMAGIVSGDVKARVGSQHRAGLWSVRLGIVKLLHGVLGLEISNPPLNVERTFVGIRAQRVIAPDEQKDTFDITALTTPVPDERIPGYLDVLPGVFNRGNVIAKKNLVVGDDFFLDATVNKNLPKNIPSYRKSESLERSLPQ